VHRHGQVPSLFILIRCDNISGMKRTQEGASDRAGMTAKTFPGNFLIFLEGGALFGGGTKQVDHQF
jgi:hypothetical protein